jgi:DNA-binding response OmpR family regulator
LKILLIDDEKDILDLFHEFFNNSGFTSNAYSDPFGIEDFRENYDKYALIINDIQVNSVK